MALLPLPLVTRVVAFAVPDFEDDVVRSASSSSASRGGFRGESLTPLALVCRRWASPLLEVAAQARRGAVALSFQGAGRSDVLGARRELAQRGAHVRELRVRMGSFASFGEYFSRHHGLHFLDEAHLGWDALLAHAPGLRRLDLSRMPMDSVQLRLAIEAAASRCPQLEALLLPGKERQQVEADEVIWPVMQALYDGMKHWRGLRQLTVPSRTERDKLRSTREFLEHVMQFCPDVELLDGHKQSLREMDRLTCHDQWIVPLELWERFNATCTKLREFNWVVAPFADPFFKAFGEHVKPNLTVLTFCVNMLWDWTGYFQACGELSRDSVGLNGASRRPGYGFKAVDASTALKACPMLDILEVGLYHPLEPDVFDNPEMAFDREYDFLANSYPDHEVINPDIFDDKFCERLATDCPLVSRFVIWEVVEGYNEKIEPIKTFTDQGLTALSKLKFLSYLELRSVNCTGEGMFSLLSGLSDEFKCQRTFQIALGGASIGARNAFYDAVMGLLTRIEQTDKADLKFDHRKFVLRLTNASLAHVDRGWSDDYMKRLEKFVKSIKVKHPSLRIRITTSGRMRNSFSSIIEFGLYTEHSEPSVWYGWDDEEPDRNVSFANRGGASGFMGNGLPLDVDSLPLNYELPAEFVDGYDDDTGAYYDDYDNYGEMSDENEDDEDEFWDQAY